MRASGRWHYTFRPWFVANHPICCNPLAYHADGGAITEQVHHVIPIRERPDLAFDEDNCRPLCGPCHRAIELMVRQGKETRELFGMAAITVVAGPPGAGKSYYVDHRRQPGDIIIDRDALMAAISGLPYHAHRRELWPYVGAAVEAIISMLAISRRSAWIITSEPDVDIINAMAMRLSASVVIIGTPAGLCTERLRTAGRNQDAIDAATQWHGRHNQQRSKSLGFVAK